MYTTLLLIRFSFEIIYPLKIQFHVTIGIQNFQMTLDEETTKTKDVDIKETQVCVGMQLSPLKSFVLPKFCLKLSELTFKIFRQP